TTISYELPENNFVNITIYDLLGREVKVLVSGELASGYHDVIWDGTNELGQSVSAGVYLYSVIAGNKVYSGKMVLMK
ncbi:MAG: FlgD immunoglobulin-like domain containing protein, partial [Candidatus Marinimicrobia bacterium]|nr:FlgD immunoglobulin-like domain containing protein [Candidatus Neomarinimicrobiota bacterium]